MRIVLLGAPGAGKGTQCKRILEEYTLAHMSSGDILRKERSENTDLGKQAQGYMDSGALVPDGLIVEMMVKAINDLTLDGFILDGFPRTVNQATELDKALDNNGKKIDVVLNLEVNDTIIAERMSGRRSCPKCGAVYHLTNLKPKVEGVCDNDGEALIQRPDDDLDVVKKRLVTYHEQTMPVVGYYKGVGTAIHDIDANGGADIVDTVIKKILGSISVS
jgi:adenylate kinase